MSKGLFVTGQPSCGKTTLISHLTRLAIKIAPELPVGGFITEEICQAGGSRVGFDVVDVLEGQRRGVLARKGLASRFKTGAYGVDVAAFEATALPLLGVADAVPSPPPSRRLVIIDEIGRMELHSLRFAAAVEELLSDPHVLLLGSVAAPRYGHVVPLAESVKARPDVCTVHIKPSTREEARAAAEEALRALLAPAASGADISGGAGGTRAAGRAEEVSGEAMDDAVDSDEVMAAILEAEAAGSGDEAAGEQQPSDAAAARKANKKAMKAARRAKREGRAPSDVGNKPCGVCSRSVDMLIRCRIDESREWKMVCGRCWKGVSGGVTDGDVAHPWYQYGGLWRNRK